MTIKQQINYGAMRKLRHLHSGIFYSIHLPQFYSNTSTMFLIKITKYGMRENKILFIYGCFTYNVISKEVENCIFKHNHIFRHTCIYKRTILTK